MCCYGFSQGWKSLSDTEVYMINNVFIKSLRENAKNKGTQPNKKITGFKSGFQKRIWKYEPDPLNEILEEFYATVRTKDGEDNGSDSFRFIVTAVNRYLTEKE